MAVSVENLGAGLGQVTPPAPPIPPGTQATYVLDPMSSNEYDGPLAPYWSMDYTGSTSSNDGLTLRRSDIPYYMHIDPNPSTAQSGIVFWPWPLAWYTQLKHNSQTVCGIGGFWGGPEPSWGGLLLPNQSISCLTGFTGNMGQSGACYALTARTNSNATGNTFSPYEIDLKLERWTFPNNPNIDDLFIETLVDCGQIENFDRIFLRQEVTGNQWNIGAWIVKDFNADPNWQYIERGRIMNANDPNIQAGMGAFAIINRAPATITISGALVVGWGPNDIHWLS